MSPKTLEGKINSALREAYGLEDGAEIGEFKEKELKSDCHPDPSEDCCLDNNFDWPITYNTNR